MSCEAHLRVEHEHAFGRDGDVRRGDGGRDLERVHARRFGPRREPTGPAGGVLRAATTRVRLGEELRRGLAEVRDLVLGRLEERGVFDGVHVHRALVREIIEDVIRLSRLRAALFVPEDEVDPEVEMFADVFALERGAILRHEIPRVARPRRQTHVVHASPGLFRAEVDAVDVLEHLGKVIPLGHELLHVGHVRRDALVRARHVVEQTIGVVELTPLELMREGGEGLEAYEVEDGGPRGGVVRPVMKLWNLGVVKRVVSLAKSRQARLVQRPHRFR